MEEEKDSVKSSGSKASSPSLETKTKNRQSGVCARDISKKKGREGENVLRELEPEWRANWRGQWEIQLHCPPSSSPTLLRLRLTQIMR